MQVEVTVFVPVFRATVFILSDTRQITDFGATNTFLNTAFNDMFRKTVEKVSAAFRPLVVESHGSFAAAVVARSNLFQEVVAVLLQVVAGIQVGVFDAIGDRREVVDFEVDTRRLVIKSTGCLNLVFADKMKFPSLLLLVVDDSDLLQIVTLGRVLYSTRTYTHAFGCCL